MTTNNSDIEIVDIVIDDKSYKALKCKLCGYKSGTLLEVGIPHSFKCKYFDPVYDSTLHEFYVEGYVKTPYERKTLQSYAKTQNAYIMS